jgi:two-component system NarL family sensor kinase
VTPRRELRRSGVRPPTSLGRVPYGLSVFLIVPLLVLVAIAGGTALLSERLARAKSLSDAEQAAVRLTRYLVGPVLAEAIEGVPGRWEELDRRVQDRLADGSVRTVFVWNSSGHVLYTSDEDFPGGTFAPSPHLRVAATGTVVSDVVDQPEAGYPGRPDGPMMEVYVPLSVGRQRLVVESYFSYDRITLETARLRGEIIPVAVGALVVLELVQVPIGLSLLRRVRRQDAERTELLGRNLTASDRERRAIAADVHDGPVQDLAAVAYALSALRPGLPPAAQRTADDLTADVRETVGGLRTLMADLYPQPRPPTPE